ncbi:MAG TPA: hypothetical protein VGF08_01350, partial [Terriglobales bacterium]
MALRALLFSKNPETASSLVTVLAETGIRAEVSADIFTAMEKATKQPFSCVIADWIEQPESGFLLKRARESQQNRSAVAIAIVDNEPTPELVREHRLDYLIYRPISADEARSVLGKARQQMQVQSDIPSLPPNAAADGNNSSATEDADPNLLAVADELPEQHEASREAVARERKDQHEAAIPDEPAFHFARRPRFDAYLGPVAAAILLAASTFLIARSRDSFAYLARTPEGALHVLRASFSELFFSGHSGAASVGSAAVDAQQDAYFSRRSTTNPGSPVAIGVVNGEITIPDSHRLPHAFDMPLPVPQLERAEAPGPVRVYNRVPESIKNSPPIAAPLVVAVTPAQIMPVSTPP